MRLSIFLFLSVLLLSGCKSELYNNLDESEANQMLALLLYNKISAEKTSGKEGITVWVDQEHFVDAVEILRQNGFPSKKIISIQDIFPSGQLVSSPEQEAAKLSYLKGQQLEKMLSSIDGVIRVEVSIADTKVAASNAPVQSSVAVFIKYSPDVNLPKREAEIRMLILNSIPGLNPSKISLAMQRTEYRYEPLTPDDIDKITKISIFNLVIPRYALISFFGAIFAVLMISVSVWFLLRKRRV